MFVFGFIFKRVPPKPQNEQGSKFLFDEYERQGGDMHSPLSQQGSLYVSSLYSDIQDQEFDLI